VSNLGPRRLRRDGIRELVRSVSIAPADLIAPVFVDATIDAPAPIASMPGQQRLPVDAVPAEVGRLSDLGIGGVLLFGIPSSKDANGSRADASDGVIQEALGAVGSTPMVMMTDVCLCEYTDHGHCGVLADDDAPHTMTVDNDQTLTRLASIAISHADAGADVVAPSAMADGMVGAIRRGLDGAGHAPVSILSYAVKFHSSFYGPFRDAADGAPRFGDRRQYQMDPQTPSSIDREVRLDIEEGADMLIVKPAMAYLDVVAQVASTVDVPVAAYNVSGEYAMLQAAAERGWVDATAAALETVIGMRRAGASMIITYHAETIAAALG
jgi:porphobilinogen synthase